MDFEGNSLKICSRCILDSSVPNIEFDESGICNYCKIHEESERRNPLGEAGKARLDQIVKEIKTNEKNKKYDCIVGVSGGVDSTYILHLALKFGLRPLAVHFDNGWDSEIAVGNIHSALSKLDVDLRTYVVDWEEFKDLQIAFLKSSTPDLDIQTDMAIRATLYRVASEEGLKYILEGHSFRTEGSVPHQWSYGDGRYIQSIYRLFGKNKKLKSFPNLMIPDLVYYGFIKRIQIIRPLYYMDYRKDEARNILQKELGWRDYGGKHYESIYTRFIQSYLLPRKFGIDKRKIHASALVRSGQLSRQEALEILKTPPISEEMAKEDLAYFLKKLDLTEKEFAEIMSQLPKTFLDYPSYYPLFRTLKTPLRLLYKLFSPTTPQFFYSSMAKSKK